MAKLTADVEAEIQQQTEAWGRAAQQASEKISQLTPQIEQIWLLLNHLGTYVEGDLGPFLRQARSSAKEGFQAAEDLQRVLAVMMKTVLESSSQATFVHEQSLERVSQKVDSEINGFASAMSALISASASLQNELV